MNRLQIPLLMLAASAALTGCFGGGGDDAPAPVPPPAPAPPDPLAAVPDAARQSTDGLVGYLKALVAMPSDSREPLDPGTAPLPQSDTAEPTPL